MTTNNNDGFANFDFSNNVDNNNLLDRDVVDAFKAFESEDSLAKLHNGELKDQFLTLKTAALMNRDHQDATTSTMSLKSQLVRNRRMNKHKDKSKQINVANLFVNNHGSSTDENSNNQQEEQQQQQQQDEESCVDLNGQFEADDDLEEQLLCAHMLEKIQQRENNHHHHHHHHRKGKLDDTESVTTATASLSSADESGRSGVPTRKVLTLDSIVGDTGDTMRLEKASLSSRSRHSKSRHNRNTNSSSNLMTGDKNDDEDNGDEQFASEGIPTERRRYSRGNSGLIGTGHRNRWMAAEMDHSENRVHQNSQIMDQSENRIRTRRRTSVTGSTGPNESNMDRPGRMERRSSTSTSMSERRGASDRRANISGRGRRTIPSDDLDGEQAPPTPRRASQRLRDRTRSTGGRPSMATDLDNGESGDLAEGSATPRARRILPERPNSRELRRVTRDPARRGRRATIGTDILKRNLQILDQYEDESENPDDDDLAFDANFGDDMDMSLQVQDLGTRTDVWKQRRQRCGESTGALSCVGSKVERASRRGSILAATAALSSSNRTAHSSTSNLNMSQSNISSLPGLRRSSTSASVQSDIPGLRRTSTSTPISQRRLRSRGAAK